MAPDPSTLFLWSDAWLLLSAAFAEERGEVSLARVIGMADGVQHAIPSPAELNGALGRLTRAGYLTGGDTPFALSPAGRALVARAKAGTTHTLAHQAALAQLMGAAPWSPAHDPFAAALGEPARISGAEYAEAVRAHGAAFG